MVERVKISRMEGRLVSEISAAKSQKVADCRRADLAAYLARVGRFDDCLNILVTLRKQNERNPMVEVSIRIHFAEGLHSYFSNDGVSNGDGMQRAYALSVAAEQRDLRALCAAWLAQWDYARVDMKSLRSHVVESLQLADLEDHSSQSRANLVVAQILHLGNRFDLAQPWYQRAKQHATAGFDDATIGALMHNMAWQRMLVLRQTVLTSAHDIGSEANVLTSAESTAHFNEIIGDLSWRKLKPILRAQILSLGGNAAEALGLYNKNLSEDTIPGRWQANLLADKAWCHAVLGQMAEASECAASAVKNLARDTQIDDMAATHSRLAQVSRRFEDLKSFNHHNMQAKKLWQEFSEILAEAVSNLSLLDKYGNTTAR